MDGFVIILLLFNFEIKHQDLSRYSSFKSSQLRIENIKKPFENFKKFNPKRIKKYEVGS